MLQFPQMAPLKMVKTLTKTTPNGNAAISGRERKYQHTWRAVKDHDEEYFINFNEINSTRRKNALQLQKKGQVSFYDPSITCKRTSISNCRSKMQTRTVTYLNIPPPSKNEEPTNRTTDGHYDKLETPP